MNQISPNKIPIIRNHYQNGLSIESISNIMNLNFRTVKKHIIDLIPEKTSHDRVIEVYLASGSLKDTGNITGYSPTTVWRILTKHRIPVGNGTSSWKRLYHTLRRRVSNSQWRKSILIRDNFTCQKCYVHSNIVHHKTKLSEIRNQILKENPSIDPFRSYKELREFTDLVLKKHNEIEGIVLCGKCHDVIHHGNLKD